MTEGSWFTIQHSRKARMLYREESVCIDGAAIFETVNACIGYEAHSRNLCTVMELYDWGDKYSINLKSETRLHEDALQIQIVLLWGANSHNCWRFRFLSLDVSS